MTGDEIKDLTTDDIQSVYTGKAGHCCCGCSGTHTTNPKYREIRGETRGYEVDADECDLAKVKRVLRKLQRNSEAVVKAGNGCYYMDVISGTSRYGEKKGRTYVIYLVPSEAELAETRARRAKTEAENAKREIEKVQGAGI